MIDYSTCAIEKVSVHHVGNKTAGDELELSKSLLDISDEKVGELLRDFFLHPFTTPEFYSFTFSNDDFKLNPLFTYASGVFEDEDTLHEQSLNIAKQLYERSVHPQIKSGDLFVVYFTGMGIGEKQVDAVGIFKSENRQDFLKLENGKNSFSIRYEDGINIEKLDKGCIVFNTDKDSGYKMCIVDKAGRSAEAQYWKEEFLQVKPCSDEYHHTKEFMTIAKTFVTKQVIHEFDVSKADQIDLLNRSVAYFKSNDSFDKNEFEQEVFKDKSLIKSFQEFDQSYRESNNIELDDNFDISAQAVKKQARVFKSVLKLDKNFHIYIHGDRSLIKQGTEPDGRKFYKIYFDEEA